MKLSQLLIQLDTIQQSLKGVINYDPEVVIDIEEYIDEDISEVFFDGTNVTLNCKEGD